MSSDAKRLVPIIDNAPECKECGGHCCDGFHLFTANDHRPWAKKRAMKVFSDESHKHFVLTSEPWIDGDRVFISASCSHRTKEGKCEIYEDRPFACKTFPCSSVVRDNIFGKDCALGLRLRREAQQRIFEMMW